MVLLFFFVIQLRGWARRTWDWGADTLLLFYSPFILYRKSLYDQYNQCTSVEQEGAEEEPENNEDAPDDVIGGEGEDKEQEKTAHAQNNKVYDKVWACTHSWYACIAD